MLETADSLWAASNSMIFSEHVGQSFEEDSSAFFSLIKFSPYRIIELFELIKEKLINFSNFSNQEKENFLQLYIITIYHNPGLELNKH